MVWWCVMWGDERAFRGGGHLKGGEGRGGDMVVCYVVMRGHLGEGVI